MVFGEIVEPSTRALIDDDYVEYPEHESFTQFLDWEGNFVLPDNIHTLIFVEGDNLLKLFQVLLFTPTKKLCSIKEGIVNVYSLKNSTYVVSYASKNLSTGQVIESFLPWINKAAGIYCIMNKSLSTFQRSACSNKTETLIRLLSTNSTTTSDYKRLEAPNLVSGLGAVVLSYCLHTKLNCSLFVIYMDNCVLDSLNTKPIIELLEKINLELNSSNLNIYNSGNNLYL